MSMRGDVRGGGLRATEREVVAMHAVVYSKRDDVQCVIHTHSPAVTAFAVVRKPLPCVSEGLARWGFRQETPVVPYGPRGSKLAVDGIARTLDDHAGIPAVLLANHGVLVFGGSSEEAVRRCIALEEAAEVALLAAAIGGAVALLPAQAMAAADAREV